MCYAVGLRSVSVGYGFTFLLKSILTSQGLVMLRKLVRLLIFTLF